VAGSLITLAGRAAHDVADVLRIGTHAAASDGPAADGVAGDAARALASESGAASSPDGAQAGASLLHRAAVALRGGEGAVEVPATGRRTLVFDPDCMLCTRLLRTAEGMNTDHRLSPLPWNLASKEGFRLSSPQLVAEAKQGTVIRRGRQVKALDVGVRLLDDERNVTQEGADAVIATLLLTPKGRPLGHVLNTPVIRPLFQRSYEAFAPRRHSLGKIAVLAGYVDAPNPYGGHDAGFVNRVRFMLGRAPHGAADAATGGT
jgi:predicted DCC family thiol-disulfide oxidoreductase YuxK